MIQIGNYSAEGPFYLYRVEDLPASSGVYIILGRHSNQNNWEKVVDVGESENIRNRVENHDREECWQKQGYAVLAVAVIRADERNRMLIEQELRNKYNPPCGKS